MYFFIALKCIIYMCCLAYKSYTIKHSGSFFFVFIKFIFYYNCFSQQMCHFYLFGCMAIEYCRLPLVQGCFVFYSLSFETPCTWIPWKSPFRYILFHKKRLQTMLWPCYARVNSHQRWKQTRFRVCFHLWRELTSTMNVTEWQISWNSCELWKHWNNFKLLNVTNSLKSFTPQETNYLLSNS